MTLTYLKDDDPPANEKLIFATEHLKRQTRCYSFHKVSILICTELLIHTRDGVSYRDENRNFHSPTYWEGRNCGKPTPESHSSPGPEPCSHAPSSLSQLSVCPW
ncbi:hypothetical protein CDL15_Pgr028364 [Punica granatum]|uniref:Uncharacterized protein n=1 Tax=Punica granatum TaxID=22663 RepID=A0A218W5J7_PUNGR|nr:hypothetical protein CDL15_Pgr028364 [Punica granatum]